MTDEATTTTTSISWTTIERSIVINAPPDRVGEVFSDPSRFTLLFPGVEHVTVDDIYPAEGGQMTLDYRVAGMKFKLNYTVIENAPNRRVLKSEIRGTQLVTKPMLEGQNRWEWEAVEGGTKLTVEYGYEVPTSAFGQQVERWLVRRVNGENLERSLKNIKRVVEMSG